MALSVEVSELVEIFQWSNSRGIDEINDPKQKEKKKKRISRHIQLFSKTN